MNNDDNLDLLDLDDGASVDTLPEVAPFCTPRPKKPWLLLGVGLLVIILATYIIVRTIGGDSSSSMDVDLDAPVVVDTPGDTLDVPPLPAPAPDMPAPAPVPVAVAPVPPMPAPAPGTAANPTPVPENAGSPVRVIEDRKPVTFNPDKAAPAPVVKPAPKKPVAKPAPKPAPKKQVAAANGSWYVQFGSYSTRALAESAGKTLRNQHSSLFSGRQFVVLAAVMKDGNTLYRLRVPFATSADANSFCRNAKSDGVDCYVSK